MSQLTQDRIPASDIRYARTNWAGQVDLIVLGGSESGTMYYGVAVVKRTEIQVEDENGKEPGDDGYIETTKTTQTIAVEYGAGLQTAPIQNASLVANGAFVAMRIKDGRITSLETLDKLSAVPNSAWSGQTAVTVGGRTYTVASDVPCYNSAAKSWMTLSQAHGYANTANLYVSGGVVRVIEVGK